MYHLILTVTLFIIALPTIAQSEFSSTFTGRTLRVDYYHSGTSDAEIISLDQVRLEKEWPGSQLHLIDDTNLGKYRFLIHDRETSNLIYSRGFASIFGEWQTIGEARDGVHRTFHESQRFPEPQRPFQFVLQKRNKDGEFESIFQTEVDPSSRFVNKSEIAATATVLTIADHGPPASQVDLLILGDGYTSEEAGSFQKDVHRLTEVLMATEPFQSYQDRFNIRAIAVPAAESGISDPRSDHWVDSPLGLSFNSFDLDRYMLTERNRRLRTIAAQAPYDFLILLANTKKYGGGGIFQLWATCGAKNPRASYVMVHEFGHSFAGLADEYYSSPVAYEEFTKPGSEPWEPNVTALLDPQKLKWKQFVKETTPLPTPWDQATYDRGGSRSRLEQKQDKTPSESTAPQAKRKSQSRNPLLQQEKYAGEVGAFEGASYQAKGLYRPELDCIMFSNSRSDFCTVCSAAIVRIIKLYTE